MKPTKMLPNVKAMNFTAKSPQLKYCEGPPYVANFANDLYSTIATASFNNASPNTNTSKSGSTFKALNVAKVATGSTAQIKEANAKHSQIVISLYKEWSPKYRPWYNPNPTINVDMTVPTPANTNISRAFCTKLEIEGMQYPE